MAALLALAGRDDERGRGSKIDLAEAIEQLRGRVAVLYQGGRLTGPRSRPAICGLLDQFLVGLPYDASKQSWHAKVALVRMDDAEENAAWRLWIGSRNLTASDHLEFGLLLDGSSGPKARGQSIPGVDELARELVARAALPDSAASLLKTAGEAKWVTPTGVRVPEVRLLRDSERRYLPVAPRGVEEVTVVSPFLHPRTVREIGSWGASNCRRRILSTIPELARVYAAQGNPLAGYVELLALNGALQAAEEAELDESTEVEAGAERHEPGLHAKLLVARRGDRLTMWVGSANATERAWRGRNVELVARMEGPATLYSGIEALLGTARPVTLEQLASIGAVTRDEAEERLEAARAHVVATWTGRLVHEEGIFRLACDSPPHSADTEIGLLVGRVVGPMQVWPRGAGTILLGVVPPAEQTGLVTLSLRLADKEVTWLQGCSVHPPLGELRDRAALAAYLGASAFLVWLRSLLDGELADGDASGPWDASGLIGRAEPPDSADQPEQITVEEILRSWARDPSAFRLTDQRMRDYLQEVILRVDPADAKSAALLRDVGAAWDMLRSELIGSA
ncbi:phospholipase D family protein [Falsiroseomonas sp. HW251]|uniref:phospholipase D family protein n=1 Tax=Falsiroseomonas sp. HW251 TaxID=3390998 RepID=UPI003D31889A